MSQLLLIKVLPESYHMDYNVIFNYVCAYVRIMLLIPMIIKPLFILEYLENLKKKYIAIAGSISRMYYLIGMV